MATRHATAIVIVTAISSAGIAAGVTGTAKARSSNGAATADHPSRRSDLHQVDGSRRRGSAALRRQRRRSAGTSAAAGREPSSIVRTAARSSPSATATGTSTPASARTRDGREIVLIDNRYPGRAGAGDLPSSASCRRSWLSVPREQYIVETRRADQSEIDGRFSAPPVEPSSGPTRSRRSPATSGSATIRRASTSIRSPSSSAVATIGDDQMGELGSLGEAMEQVHRGRARTGLPDRGPHRRGRHRTTTT